MSDTSPKAATSVTAACGAYLLVALADARVETIEEARFLAGVVNHDAFRPFETNAIAAEYNRLMALLESDWDAAEAEILGAIGAVKGDKASVAAIKVAAQQAVIADQIIKPQEEFELARIARALGVNADDL